MPEEHNAEYYAKMATVKFSRYDYEGGVADLSKAIDLDPDNIEYYRRRASFWDYREQYRLAIGDQTKVIELTQDLEDKRDAYIERVLLYQKARMPEQLIEDISWLIDNGFGDYNFYSWRGEYYLELKNPEAAIIDFTEAYSLNKKQYAYLWKRARAFYADRQYEMASQDLEQVLKKHKLPITLLVYFYSWRGRVLYKLGRLEEALADFNKEMRLTSKPPFLTPVEYLKTFFPDEL